MSIDVDKLNAEAGAKVTLAGPLPVETGGSTTAISGFNGLDSVYLEASVQLRQAVRGAAGLTLLVEQSTDGLSWSTAETFSYGYDGLQTATLTSPDDYLRVSWTVANNSEWYIKYVTAAIGSTGGGGGGSGQPLDSDLTAIAALSTTPYGRALLELADAPAGRTALGLGTLSTQSGTFSGTSSGTNTGDQTTVTGNAGTATALQTGRAIDGQTFDGTAAITVIAPGTHAATGKTTPVDTDEMALVDSAASNVLKKVTWANVKATLKTYLDTLYQPVDSDLTAIAALSTTSYGRALLTAANLAALYTTLAVDTDGTLAANSDAKIASQKAVKTYVDISVPVARDLSLAESGVLPSNSFATNNTAADVIIAEAALTGATVYLRGVGQPYPLRLILPNAPIRIRGDSPTSSILQGPTGITTSLLTYDPTLGKTSTIGAAFSSQRGGSGAQQVAATPYIGSQWIVENLGFTTIDGGSSGNKGWNFPTWDGSVFVQDKLTLWANNCIVSNMWGTAIDYKINGCTNDSYISNTLVFNNEGRGFDLGSDSRWINCVAANNGYEGFYSNGKCPMLDGCKSWSNGTLDWTRGIGLYITGEAPATLVTNFYTQDNFSYGVVVDTTGRVTINGLVSDRDCAHTGGVSSGVHLKDAHDTIINGYACTDSSGWTRTNPTGNVLHAIYVENTGGVACFNNYVQLVQATSLSGYDGNTATMGVPVDPASNLSGTVVMCGDGLVSATDLTPIGTQYVQPGFSVTVNRKFALGASATLAPTWGKSALSLGAGSIFRIL